MHTHSLFWCQCNYTKLYHLCILTIKYLPDLVNLLILIWSLHLLGQHNFDFRSVSRFHGSGSEAGLISISHFTNLPQLFIMRLHSIRISHFMCAWDWSEAGNLSHFIVPLSSAEVVRAVLFLILFHNLIKFQPILDSELSALKLESGQLLCWSGSHPFIYYGKLPGDTLFRYHK